jgi:diguanylate cyclase (GGDEF)-like protein
MAVTPPADETPSLSRSVELFHYMYSLYHSLLAQHSRQVTSVRCAEQTIAQLHRYFEDVVLENNLSALVVESLPFATHRSLRDFARIRDVGNVAKNSFYFVTADDALTTLPREKRLEFKSIFLEAPQENKLGERFVVIADARFSALLASPPLSDIAAGQKSGAEVIWTFEPDVVYSALEYLMARVTAECPERSGEFANAVKRSMPKATSLQLTVSVTTKLAQLLQAQAEREIAVNRIATAIRNSLELNIILQTAANEVGRALNVSSCGLRVEGDSIGEGTTKCYIRQDIESESSERVELMSDLDTLSIQLAESPKTYFADGDNSQSSPVFPRAVVPLIYHDRLMGLVLVRSDDTTRAWAENELLLLHTVADQLTVAINQAHLFAQLQQQALTDGLTGCFNRRAFEMQLERDLHLAMRMRQPLSLIMLDLDNLKQINDGSGGHEAGDRSLRLLAHALRAELRAVDTAARFGGDEFAIILPQADSEGALMVAERLRSRIEELSVPGVDPMTASFGLASFPGDASSRDTLVGAADQALYKAKHTGRNRVCLAAFELGADSVSLPGPEVEMETIRI